MSTKKRKAEIKTRWGIYGSALRYVDGAEVVAVGSRSKDTSVAFGQRFGIAESKCYANYEDFVKDEDIDIVYISVVNPFHKQGALLALNAGKGVLCEKPLALNSKEVQEMVALAKAKNLFFMEGMWTRFFPAVVEIRRLIESGEIGQVVDVNCGLLFLLFVCAHVPDRERMRNACVWSIYCCRFETVLIYQKEFGFLDHTTPRLTDPNLGGGALLDIGIYIVAFASMIYGPQAPSIIHSVGELSDEKVDRQVAILLQYGPSQTARLLCTFNAAASNTCFITGTKGTVRVSEPFWCPTEITVWDAATKKSKTNRFALPKVNTKADKFNFRNSIGFAYEAQHVHDRFHAGEKESDVITIDESIVIIGILDTIRKQIGVRYPNEQ